MSAQEVVKATRHVVNMRTGELIDLDTAETVELASCMTDLQEVREQLKEIESAVSDALIERMDKAAQWTVRVGDPTDRQWEIKASSPTAGSETYPPDLLERELHALVARDTITEAAAAKALKRQAVVTLDIPLGLDLKETTDGLRELSFDLEGVRLPVAGVDSRRSTVMAGISALRKVSGTGAGLDRAKIVQPVGARRAKVVLKVRAS
jgi:hypothetical protein